MSDTVGVVIGRFQVDDLHTGHRYLINEVFKHHKKVLIFIGVSPIQGTKHDPLDYHTRERMLRAAYPNAIILPQHDHQSNEEWSKILDRQIRGLVPDLAGAKLYGGRDSFQPCYTGEFQVITIDSPIEYLRSGTDQRKELGKVVRSTADFRAGVIYATQHTWPYTMACVDIACLKTQEASEHTVRELADPLILLGRKASEVTWRLPGGKVDANESLESAAKREFHEETGLLAEGGVTYLGSFPVGDWRFKNAGEMSLITGLFLTPYAWGTPKGNDDLVKVQWFPLSEAEEAVLKNHKQLVAAVKSHLKAYAGK